MYVKVLQTYISNTCSKHEQKWALTSIWYYAIFMLHRFWVPFPFEPPFWPHWAPKTKTAKFGPNFKHAMCLTIQKHDCLRRLLISKVSVVCVSPPDWPHNAPRSLRKDLKIIFPTLENRRFRDWGTPSYVRVSLWSVRFFCCVQRVGRGEFVRALASLWVPFRIDVGSQPFLKVSRLFFVICHDIYMFSTPSSRCVLVAPKTAHNRPKTAPRGARRWPQRFQDRTKKTLRPPQDLGRLKQATCRVASTKPVRNGAQRPLKGLHNPFTSLQMVCIPLFKAFNGSK